MKKSAIVSLCMLAGLAPLVAYTVVSRGTRETPRTVEGSETVAPLPPHPTARSSSEAASTGTSSTVLAPPPRSTVVAEPEGRESRPAPTPAALASRDERAGALTGPVASRPRPDAEQAAGKVAALGSPVNAASPKRTVGLAHERKGEEFLAPSSEFNTEAYSHLAENPFLGARANPLSTFSVDVDTASYANVRRFLTSGQLPPKDAVRVEELLNYFHYDYPEPKAGAPFSITTKTGPCPWAPRHRLVLVGLHGRSIDLARVPPRSLTFLLDVSGSMSSPDKLPLLKRAMTLLADTLREEDRVAIVVYAGAAGLVLPPTSGADRATVLAALDSLDAGGSTAGGAGIELAYRVAADGFIEGGINRVVLATDGDFNVGVSSEGELVRLIEEKRRSGVFLSVLGFGRGNLQDSRMEKIADHGNGNYSYIDSVAEARKVLVSEAGGTLVTIAKDVKVQVELNPTRVAAYRLVGYENRLLRAEDFADDGKDAGEIGAGHTVTALYEIVPVGVPIDLPHVDPLRYRDETPAVSAHDDELLTVKLRHKDPEGDRSRLQTTVVHDAETGAGESTDLRFASAVAAFGMLLRDSEHRGDASWSLVRELAEGAQGTDVGGYRAQFLELTRLAQELSEAKQLAVAR